MRSDYTQKEWDKLPWHKKVVLGQEAIAPIFGAGRVTSVSDGSSGSVETISVRSYADNRERFFTPDAVSLIDPSGLILTPYKAMAPQTSKYAKFRSTKIQSRTFPAPRLRGSP